MCLTILNISTSRRKCKHPTSFVLSTEFPCRIIGREHVTFKRIYQHCTSVMCVMYGAIWLVNHKLEHQITGTYAYLS